MRHVRVTTGLAALAAAGALLTGTAAAAPAATTDDLAATVHTAGRVVPGDGVLRYSWPGVSFEGRFRGTGVGIVLDDAVNDYDVVVDGVRVETLVTPGSTTHQVSGLADTTHTIRVVKRSESPWATSTFGGFVAVPGGEVLPAPAPRDLQIELVGDSLTAGYGNESTSRDCTGDQVQRTTNADLSFGAIASRELGADYQVNAFSGRGMVRNYGGGEPGTSYRTYADRALLAVAGDVWQRPASWQPDVVVVGLGVNDFSTPVGAGEPWTATSLRAAYLDAYAGFVDTLRARYGPQTHLVLSSTSYGGPDLPGLVQQVVDAEVAAGDDRVVHWDYSAVPLDLTGCHWHPSLADHRRIATSLTGVLEDLPLGTDPSPTPTPTPTPTATPTPAPTATPTSSPTPTPTPTPVGPACRATLQVVSSWPGGYQAAVTVTAGTSAVDGWSTTFTLPTGGAVAQAWSADVTTSGTTVTARNVAWNGRLASGASTALGFLGTGPAPTSGAVTCAAT
ncbi:cellulose binding domain-containing protein [Cellulomonas oligotrophica]|uniref:Lysophospholipase L1-like esterase n=1 Tax=Cellulomonas oligotrophica TaxID=931536 RepID=A0A7Y9FG35_9CELL|nr:cellulose binding domain-containing protein [Cellulomonas oligotrophica]NYD86565.1 lysophospholipase L1-like esterase [Cellulomonas oligotrophica]GIG32545.1 hypothetical protein Col01nite_17040 [Cellulomonas oligotrophica]